MILIPFEPHHLKHLELQSAQEEHYEDFEDFAAYGNQLKRGLAYTVIDGENISLCCGVLDKWQGVGCGWVLFSKHFRPHCFRSVHRNILGFMDTMLKERYHRIEITVRLDYKKGHRWAKLLGFTMGRCFA